MVSNLLFSQLILITLVWVFLMLCGLWPLKAAAARPIPPTPPTPRGKHAKKSKPFPGLSRKLPCDACEQAIKPPTLQPPSMPPPTVPSSRGRRRQVDTSQHFCPDPDCQQHLANLRRKDLLPQHKNAPSIC